MLLRTPDHVTHGLLELRNRAKGDTRSAPSPPELTQLLHAHLAMHGTDAEGRLFRGVRSGRELEESTYHRVWRKGRQAALTAEEYASPLARRPYDLRHAAVSTWLNAGVPATQVAEWQATVSLSCCRSTRSASRGRRNWLVSESRPGCVRRSGCRASARIRHRQPLSAGLCRRPPDNPRRRFDLIGAGQGAVVGSTQGCPRWESNPHCGPFKGPASAFGLRGRARTG